MDRYSVVVANQDLSTRKYTRRLPATRQEALPSWLSVGVLSKQFEFESSRCTDFSY